MNAEDIISEIEQYVSTPDTPFAVLLEGPWGCGKTRFVKNELAPALEELDDPCIVIRASMVGVVTADETFSRIATAAVCDYADIEADASRKRRKLVKKAAKKLRLSYLKAQADKILKTTGLSYSPSSDLITALLLPKRCLLVLDDVERRGEIDDLGFFGVVDSLVERFDKKVLIVHASEGDPLGEEITEKLVWNKFELTPDYEFICKSVFREAIGACSSLEVHAAVADGVKASGNKNLTV